MVRSPQKIVAGIAVVMVVFLFVATSRHHSASSSDKDKAKTDVPSSVVDTASVDDDSETIKHLIATMDATNQNVEAVKAENESIKKENDALRAMVSKKLKAGQLAMTNPSQGANGVSGAGDTVSEALEAQIASLKHQIDAMGAHTGGLTNPNSASAYPLNNTDNAILSASSGMQTIVLDADEGASKTKTGYDGSSTSQPLVKASRSSPSAYTYTKSDASLKPIRKIPVYTIPALSNLANTVLMNSIIGEVPQGNTFEQPPFPFQALVGKHELLAANGLHLPPDIAGMKVSGYSVGVGSFVQGISCSRSYITKILFVFDDGHFTVYGKEANGNNVDPSDTLGYLSDVHGNPCIQGTYVSNAARVLTILTGMSMVQGAGEGLQQAQTNTLTGFNGTTTVFNGNIGKYAVGSGVSTSMDKASTYMLDRLKGTFDIVYTPASKNGRPTTVVANFTKTIPIDYSPNGRQIRYEPYGASYAKAPTTLDLD